MTSPSRLIATTPGQTLVPCDEYLLERARTQWQFGDWQSLAQIEHDALLHHHERARIALFVAAGLLQTGHNGHAMQFIRIALDCGVSKNLVGRILIAGAHNSLGRAAVIADQPQRALEHFENAVRIGSPGSDVRLFARARFSEQLQQIQIQMQKHPAGFAAAIVSRPENALITGKSAAYPVNIKLYFGPGNEILYIGLGASKRGRVKCFSNLVEYQTEQGKPLYLVSNENGEFEKPPMGKQINLKPNAHYVIAGKIGHQGGSQPVIWLFQYSKGKRVDSVSTVTAAETGRFRREFVVRPEADAFAIGIRLTGSGRVDLASSIIELREESVDEVAAQFDEKIKKIERAQKSEIENAMKQIEATIRLQHYLGSDIMLPDLHNWPISPDYGVLLINLIEQNEYDAIIEFGSGTSTVIVAKVLQRVSGRKNVSPAAFLSFDHLPEYHEKTRMLLRQAGLGALVNVQLAPLSGWEDAHGGKFLYYECAVPLKNLHQSLSPLARRVLVIVDGPPAATGKHARYPALPKVLAAFSPDQLVIHFLLDDYVRKEEQEIASRWREEIALKGLPFRQREFNHLEKKACLLEVGVEVEEKK